MAAVSGCKPKPARVVLTAPAHGEFVQGAAVTFNGKVVKSNSQAVTVNGEPVTFDGPNAKTFHYTHDLSADETTIFHTAVAELVHGGSTRKDATTVIEGEALVWDQHAPDGLGVRINESALGAVALALEESGQLDLEELLPLFTVFDAGIAPLIIDFRAADRMSLRVTSKTNRLKVRYTLYGLFVKADLTDVIPNPFGDDGDCEIQLEADRVAVEAEFKVKASANGNLKVESDDVDVWLDDADPDTCVDDILPSFVKDTIEDLIKDQFVEQIEDFIGDDGFEEILEEITELDIGAAIGEELGFDVSVPITAAKEDSTGITVEADLQVAAPEIAAGAPDLHASYYRNESVPTYTETMDDGTPFGIGIGLSTTAMNQFLMAATEKGFLQDDVDGALLASVLQLPADSYVIEVRPTLAPIVSGEAGPAGQPLDIHLGHLIVRLVGGETGEWMEVLISGRGGLDLVPDPEQGGFVADLQLAPAGLDVQVIDNETGFDDTILGNAIGQVFALELPSLGEKLGVIELPNVKINKDARIALTGLPTTRDGTYATVHADAVAQICLNSNGKPKANGVTIQCYQDQDADGFPVSSVRAVSVYVCASNPVCPDGWTPDAPETVGGDCADRHPVANPNHSGWEVPPHENGWDWNCDGEEEKRWVDKCKIPGSGCGDGFWLGGDVPSCGDAGICILNGCNEALDVMQECR